MGARCAAGSRLLAGKGAHSRRLRRANITEVVTASGFAVLEFSAAHAERLRDLPWHHRDPFDRMLIAQAQVEGLTLVTVDRRVHDYEIKVL